MAKEINYTDERGVFYDKSYWFISSTNLDIKDKRMVYNFIGYKNKAAKEASKQPIGQMSCIIGGKEFDECYTKILTKESNLVELGYEIVSAKKDIPTDEQGVFKSFFENSKDV